jgi:hypothetical protein
LLAPETQAVWTTSFLGLHSNVLLSPSVVHRLGHFDHLLDVSDGLALADQLISRLLLLFEKASPTHKPSVTGVRRVRFMLESLV